MALPTFGVTFETLEYRFEGIEYDSWGTQIDRWIQQASARLTVKLRQQNYESAAVDALGASSELYLICQQYIEAFVSDQVARSSARHDTDAARAAREEMEGVLDDLRACAENLTQGRDVNQVRGTFRGGGRRNAALMSPWARMRHANRCRRARAAQIAGCDGDGGC